ncbi:hypothetical protein Tco_1149693, partial [Tanacetum coccineum]
MYPKFLQLFLNNQIENLAAVFNDEYDTPSHTKKVFANMRRQGKDFSGTVTPLFATMLIQSQAVEGEGLGQPTEPQHTPTTASPSHSNDPPLSCVNTLGGGEDSMKLNELMEICIKLSERVLALENIKTAQDLEITNLKKRVKKLEKKKKSRTSQLKRRLFKVRIESSTEKSLGDQDDASKQGRNEIDQDKVIMKEASETATRPIVPPKQRPIVPPQQQLNPKDKEKGIMQEPEKPVKVKGKDQIEYDVDMAKRLQAELDEEVMLEREREKEASNAALIEEWDTIEARIDADAQLAERLQAKEREHMSVEERARL